MHSSAATAAQRMEGRDSTVPTCGGLVSSCMRVYTCSAPSQVGTAADAGPRGNAAVAYRGPPTLCMPDSALSLGPLVLISKTPPPPDSFPKNWRGHPQPNKPGCLLRKTKQEVSEEGLLCTPSPSALVGSAPCARRVWVSHEGKSLRGEKTGGMKWRLHKHMQFGTRGRTQFRECSAHRGLPSARVGSSVKSGRVHPYGPG